MIWGFLQRLFAGDTTTSASSTLPVAVPSGVLSETDQTKLAGQLIDRGDVDAGFEVLDGLPRNVDSVLFRAVGLTRLERHAEAAELARELLSMEITPKINAEASLILVKAGAFHDALAPAINAVLAGSERAVYALRAAARKIDDEIVWRRVAEALRGAMANMPTSEEVRLGLYEAMSATSTFNERGAFLDELYAESKSPDPPFWRAQWRVRVGDLEGARADFAEARRRGGRAVDIEYTEAHLYRTIGDLERAALHIVPIDVLESNRGAAWLLLGFIRAQQGRLDDARKAYARSIEANTYVLESALKALERDPSVPQRERDINDLASFVALAPLSDDVRANAEARIHAMRP